MTVIWRRMAIVPVGAAPAGGVVRAWPIWAGSGDADPLGVGDSVVRLSSDSVDGDAGPTVGLGTLLWVLRLGAGGIDPS